MRFLGLVLVAALVAGCSGGQDGQRAQELLTLSQTAQAKLHSVAYEARMTFDVQMMKISVQMDGAAQLTGRHKGDQFLRVRMNGLPQATGAAGYDIVTAIRGTRVTMAMNGQVQSFNVPQPDAHELQAFANVGSKLTACVRDVDVAEGRALNGEPATRIAGVLDTSCILESISGMSGLSQFAGQDVALEQLADHVDDIRATLFVSDRSHLLLGAVVTTAIEAPGQKIDVRVVYRLKSVNKPVRFPSGL